MRLRSKKRRRLGVTFISLLPLLLVSACSGASQGPLTPVDTDVGIRGADEVPGLVTYISKYDVPSTVTKLGDALRAAGGRIVATPEPASYSRTGGQPLPVATVVVGTMPRLDAALTVSQQRSALNLPQKYLVWASADKVYVAYNSASYLAQSTGPGAAAAKALGAASARAVAAATGAAQPASVASEVTDGERTTTIGSIGDVNTTVGRLLDAAGKLAVPWPTVIDEAAEGAGVGMTVPDTTIVLFDDPVVTTPLVQANPWSAIDLPLRFLIWKNSDGKTEITYPDVDMIARRYGFPKNSTPVVAMGSKMREIAVAAVNQSP